MDKKSLVYIHYGILFSYNKNEILNFASECTMLKIILSEETQIQKEQQISHVLSH